MSSSSEHSHLIKTKVRRNSLQYLCDEKCAMFKGFALCSHVIAACQQVDWTIEQHVDQTPMVVNIVGTSEKKKRICSRITSATSPSAKMVYFCNITLCACTMIPNTTIIHGRTFILDQEITCMWIPLWLSDVPTSERWTTLRMFLIMSTWGISYSSQSGT